MKMNLIKINAIDSTNTYLFQLSKTEVLPDKTIVVTERQIKGRGQMGASWFFEEHNSLAFSILKKCSVLFVKDQNSISYAVSIGIKKAMESLTVPKIFIKWPNDIMSDSKKMAGILIENQVRNNKVVASVIGIGLNVNNTFFEDLPQATSMCIASEKKHSLDEVLQVVSEAIFKELKRVENQEHLALKTEYEANLFRKDIITVFEDANKNRFNGKIKGISEFGELLLETEIESLHTYRIREIKMLY